MREAINYLILAVMVNVLCLAVIALKWRDIRKCFDEKTYTYFEIIFVSLYFLEQAIFIVLSYFYQDYNSLFVGLFALIVLTTVAFNKLMMESKSRRILRHSKHSLERVRDVRERYEKAMEQLTNNQLIRA